MNKFDKIEEFLKLILEIKKNGVEIDANLVYSNLININSKKESVRSYFTSFIDRFRKDRNIIIKSDDYFSSFKTKDCSELSNKIKMYIPLNISHFNRGVNLIFDFLLKNGIIFDLKICSDIRIDDVILLLNNDSDCEKVRKFLQENTYLSEGLLNTNPFAISDGNISITYDDILSYNYVVALWISDYVNTHEEVSFSSFYDYIYDRYLQVFRNGKDINNFAKDKKFMDYVNGLIDYQIETEVLLLALKGASLTEFYEYYKNINVEKRKEMSSKIREFLKNDMVLDKVSSDEKEIFDYAIIEIAKSSDIDYAFQTFRDFDENGNYRVFTRKNNLRNLLFNNLSRGSIHYFLLEEQKIVLNKASTLTMKKYDAVQLARALFKLRDGDYSGFTNDENARENLRLLVSSDNLHSVINSILLDNGYKIEKEDEIWVYVEIIEKLKSKSI